MKKNSKSPNKDRFKISNNTNDIFKEQIPHEENNKIEHEIQLSTDDLIQLNLQKTLLLQIKNDEDDEEQHIEKHAACHLIQRIRSQRHGDEQAEGYINNED